MHAGAQLLIARTAYSLISCACRYVTALNGGPQPQLSERIMLRLSAICTNWEQLQALPICQQASQQIKNLHTLGTTREDSSSSQQRTQRSAATTTKTTTAAKRGGERRGSAAV